MIPMPLPTRTVVARTLDARHLNAVVNDPSVRVALHGSAGDGPIDLTPYVRNPENFAFASEHGGFLCIAVGSGRYDVHSMFLPDGRGGEAVAAMREATDYMFSATDCLELRTRVPVSNRAAAVLAQRAWFEKRYDGSIRWPDDTVEAATYHGLSLDRWALTSRALPVIGAWFHAEIAEAKKAAGSTLPVHSDDQTHDCMVGAAVLMTQAGTVDKAVRFYNVWAGCSQAPLIQLVRARPIILDLQDVVIEVRPTGMEILLCR